MLLVGAVAYDPKVVTIWEGLRAYFRSQHVELDFALFSNYERQVEELLKGHIDIAWNTPLAHVRIEQRSEGRCRALGMRDSDRDFHSRLIVRNDAGIGSLKDLHGKVVATGSRDSTQARILPLYFLEQNGVELAKVKWQHFDTDLGKHGDTGTSELDVLRALHEGRASAGVVGDLIWVAEQSAGRIDTQKLSSFWTSDPYDHCMFDAKMGLSNELCEAFQKALFSMSWDNPEHRHILQLEGLKQWLPPRHPGYESLKKALLQLEK